MKTSILILIPMAPNMPDRLKEESLVAIQKLQRPGIQIVIDSRGAGDAGISSNIQRCDMLSELRNALVRDYLMPHHTHIMMMDADLVKYPSDLPKKLLDNGGDNAIIGASCYVDGMYPRWYDTGGFIDHGHRCRHDPPHFDQQGDLIELDSVGACYIAPARLFREGAEYRVVDPDYTDHYSICQQGKQMRMRVVCDMKTEVFHANLPQYGVPWHP